MVSEKLRADTVTQQTCLSELYLAAQNSVCTLPHIRKSNDLMWAIDNGKQAKKFACGDFSNPPIYLKKSLTKLLFLLSQTQTT